MHVGWSWTPTTARKGRRASAGELGRRAADHPTADSPPLFSPAVVEEVTFPLSPPELLPSSYRTSVDFHSGRSLVTPTPWSLAPPALASQSGPLRTWLPPRPSHPGGPCTRTKAPEDVYEHAHVNVHLSQSAHVCRGRPDPPTTRLTDADPVQKLGPCPHESLVYWRIATHGLGCPLL